MKLLSETLLILNRIQQYIIIHLCRYSCKVPVNSCEILIKLEFHEQMFEKSPNIKFHENVQWQPSCSTWTDRNDGTNSCFLQFANMPKNHVESTAVKMYVGV